MKMSVVHGSRLLCIFAVIHCHWLAGNTRADRFTNGFPNVLVTQISRDTSSNYTLRLIPDMSFTCNGTIVGFTVAGRRRDDGRSDDPIIQIWRPQNTSQLSTYYTNSSDFIAIDKRVCAESSIVFQQQGSNGDPRDQVWNCNLIDANRVRVQAGDVLGLLLPPRINACFCLSIAGVSSKGPTNYVFESREFKSHSTVNLCDATFVNNQLPQIAIDFDSESDTENGCSKCVTGFTDMPAFEVRQCTNGSNVLTILIPHMTFTYNATIAGFIVAGTNFTDEPHFKIQIWRQNYSQPGTCYKVQPDIIVNGTSGCASRIKIAKNISFCILKSMAVSVQPGDFLGLEIPQTDENSGIYFTSGGQENYVFTGALNSSVKLANNSTSGVVQQRPQIAFNLTSDQCTSGFLSEVTKATGERLESINMATTVLLPNLTFGCNGTIVRLTIAVAHNYYDSKQQKQLAPKIQIWKETQNLYKSGPEIPVSNSSCVDMTLIEGILQCTLSEAARVSVQPGDILGVEIPPIAADHNGYEILFNASSESTAHIFRQNQPSSTVILAEADDITSHLPQIIPLVILGQSTDRCSGDSIESVTPPGMCNPPTDSTTTHNGKSGAGQKAAVISSIVVFILLAIITILVVIIVLQQRRWKKQKQALNSIIDSTYSNSAYNAVPDETPDGPVPEYEEVAESDADLDQRESSNEKDTCSAAKTQLHYYSVGPQSFKDNHDCTVVQNEALQIHLDNQNYVCGTYEMQDVENLSEVKEGESEYWEPAATANELYRQMASEKYREIDPQQIETKDALGSGQFGEVSKGIWQSPMGAMDVAVKQLQPGASEEEKVKFLQEAAINGQFRHPNVVKLMGVVTVGESTMIVLELLSNGDLRNFLIKQQPRQVAEKQESIAEVGVDKNALLRFCQQIATGMSYLASKAFIHRDLATRNILVSGDKICKISDFGMSRNLMDENYYVSHGGKVPVKWTAPEAIHYKKYSTASDVWSFGCVMYEIWSLGHKPFENFTNPEAMKMVDKGYRLPPPPGLTKELYKIMIQCWQPERSRRPTFPQLVEMLSRADFELFVWEEEDLRNSDPQVKIIGAPLELAKNLYHQLQRVYFSS